MKTSETRLKYLNFSPENVTAVPKTTIIKNTVTGIYKIPDRLKAERLSAAYTDEHIGLESYVR